MINRMYIVFLTVLVMERNLLSLAESKSELN